MGEVKKVLNEAGRYQIALALLLLKDFKSEGRFDIEASKAVLELADFLGVRNEYDEWVKKTPPFVIKPRK